MSKYSPLPESGLHVNDPRTVSKRLGVGFLKFNNYYQCFEFKLILLLNNYPARAKLVQRRFNSRRTRRAWFPGRIGIGILVTLNWYGISSAWTAPRSKRFNKRPIRTKFNDPWYEKM